MATKRDLLKRNVAQAEVACRLGVSRETNGDIRRMKAKPLDQPPELDAWQCRALRHRLLNGAQAASFPDDAWTLRCVHLAIASEFGATYSKAGS